MNRRVVLTARARKHILDALEWYTTHDPTIAREWYEGVLDAIQSLGQSADSQPLAVLADPFPVPLRAAHYGLGRRTTHRIVFAIRPEGVFVYAVWHVSRDEPRASDL